MSSTSSSHDEVSPSSPQAQSEAQAEAEVDTADSQAEAQEVKNKDQEFEGGGAEAALVTTKQPVISAGFDDSRVLIRVSHPPSDGGKCLVALRSFEKKRSIASCLSDPPPTRSEVLWRYANTVAVENEELKKRLRVMQKTVDSLLEMGPMSSFPLQGKVSVSEHAPVQSLIVADSHPNVFVPAEAPTEPLVAMSHSDGAATFCKASFTVSTPTQKVKDISLDLKAKLEEFELVLRQDLWDRDGRPFVPGGDNNATLLGAFPHLMVGARPASNERPKAYVCADKQVILNVSIRKKSDKSNKSITEQSLLSILKDGTPVEERSNWTAYDAKLVLFLEMRFYNEIDQNCEASKIVASEPKASQDTACSFSTPPRNGHLLIPRESKPYSHDPHYEISMEGGKATFTSHLNKGVYETNLTSDHKNDRFVFVIRSLNPYLANLDGFNITSMPFHARASSGRLLTKDEFYVASSTAGNAPILCPRSAIPITAPCPRRH